ncbi:MAG: Pls/PosA family non-ribosomal peptide synthetase, partial [Lapillicoccus sp.]
EVWNTYGPTEATVVACAARLTGAPPVRIGLPLDGWDLAVVDAAGRPVPEGASGELIIGGIGLARYLDPEKDAQKYAPMPTLGWQRAYRSGDLVRNDQEGLLFLGRADDQVKLGGRRIELGEVDSALLSLPGVTGAAAAVRKTSSGNSLLIGYLATDATFDQARALEHLRATMPAAMVPRLAQVDTLPTRTSGKIDRDALPWPLPTAETAGATVAVLDGTAGWVQELWLEILGAVVTGPTDDFFDAGGGSLSAAQLVSRLRERFPEVTVADVYAEPTVGGLASALDAMDSPAAQSTHLVGAVPPKTQAGQVISTIPLRVISGLRWLTWILAGNNVAAAAFDVTWLPTVSWWLVALGWVLLVSAPGRMVLTVVAARAILRGVTPGDYPRGGKIHLRVWLAERVADELGAANLSGAPWMRQYARALGASVGPDVDLHSIPPVTGFLHLGAACSIEQEVDLAGHWLDGDVLHLGTIRVGKGARVGARSTLLPGADVGEGAEIIPGSAVFGPVPADEWWSGAPARPGGTARGPWTGERPLNRPVWLAAYGVSSVLISLLPLLAVLAGVASVAAGLDGATSVGDAAVRALALLPLASVVALVVLTALIWAATRLLGLGLTGGHHPIHGLRAWQAWSTVRLLDEARTWLFPLYSSALTPIWLRALGARIGADVEASTVLLIPRLTTVGEGAFLADDTLLGSYELGGGWLRVGEVKIGKHAFVGNSAMTAPGRKVPRQGLVAVLSAAPRRAKAKRGTSWLGSPPRPLRRDGAKVDQSRTYHPPTRLRVARALVEVCRVVPVWVHVALVVLVVTGIEAAASVNLLLAALVSGPLLLLGGVAAAGMTSLAKWALVGRMRPGDHPLWSSFVWRNELADTFVEVVAAPWFARAATGTPVLNLWLRTLGATIGRGVWCETYWLPEADLIELRDGATVGRGCVVQTHLFHDRLLSMDTVTLRAGATLGPNSVILPAAVLGRHATVGPVSLVMRGEFVPDKTRWIGNPIAPWLAESP